MHCRTARRIGAAGWESLGLGGGRARMLLTLRVLDWRHGAAAGSRARNWMEGRRWRPPGEESVKEGSGKKSAEQPPNQGGTKAREVGGRSQGEREKRCPAGGRGGRGGRAPEKCSDPGCTGEVKRGVGEPNSQRGKSYANSALPRANQCSPSALPRDWLAPEEGGAERPGIPAHPIQVHAGVHRRPRLALLPPRVVCARA